MNWTNSGPISAAKSGTPRWLSPLEPKAGTCPVRGME
jgi:hypothetical protein